MSNEERGDPKRVISYSMDVIRGKLEPESTILRYAFATAAIMIAGSVAYALASNGGFTVPIELIMLGCLSVVMSVSTYAHMSAYREKMCCVNGMMVGMSAGMGSGFLAGALIGATNGMFMGSVGGVLVGILIGVELGRFSGIMGAMEGLMAGLMSGTMGAMLSVMMINDNLMPFLFLLFGICLIIAGALSYMIRREANEAPKGTISFAGFFMSCVIISALIALVMLFGPRGPITIW